MKSISHLSSEGMRGLYYLGPTISILSIGKWNQNQKIFLLWNHQIFMILVTLFNVCMHPFVGEQMQSGKRKRINVKNNFITDISIYGIHRIPNKTPAHWLVRPIRETSSLKSITLFLIKFAHLKKHFQIKSPTLLLSVTSITYHYYNVLYLNLF